MITITIKTDNAAFQDGQRAAEVRRILYALADQLDAGHALTGVRDSNGNRCGAITLTGKDRSL